MIARVRINALALEFPVELPTSAFISSANVVVDEMRQRLRDEAVVQFKKWLDRPHGGMSGLHLDISFPL